MISVPTAVDTVMTPKWLIARVPQGASGTSSPWPAAGGTPQGWCLIVATPPRMPSVAAGVFTLALPAWLMLPPTKRSTPLVIETAIWPAPRLGS